LDDCRTELVKTMKESEQLKYSGYGNKSLHDTYIDTMHPNKFKIGSERN